MAEKTKAVLMSIQPKWCELIASGKKTIEVRKTKPKLETPFKVYIYQTKKPVAVSFSGTGRHISEYDKTYWYNERSGKVIGEFVCNALTYIEAGYDTNGDRHLYNTAFLERRMCIPDNELHAYLYKSRENCGGWAWHISGLVIYHGMPRELSEFFHACNKPRDTDCSVCVDRRENRCKSITRPPQSWCYVEAPT